MEQAGRRVKGSKPPQVAVVVVNFNAGARRVVRLIEALRAQSFRGFEVLVVDNASRDDSLVAFEDSGLPLRLLPQSENLGFAAANNLAARETRAPLVALLNPDAYPEPGWLQALVDATQRYPEAAAFGSLQVDAGDPSRIDGAGDVYTPYGYAYRGHWRWPVEAAPRSDGETFAPCAAAALYRREAFMEVGGFDERFFCYHEDVDLGFRLRLAGWRCVQVAEARVAHEGSGISGFRSEFMIFHGTRNRIWTWVKNMPLGLLCLTAPGHIAFNLAVQYRGLKNRTLGATLRGQLAALRGLRPFLASRRETQGSRRASALELLEAMTPSLGKVRRREADLKRPIGGRS
jgi:GT2 family glycosyltransferase